MPTQARPDERAAWQRRLRARRPRPAGARARRLARRPSTNWARPCRGWLEIGGSHAQRDLFAQVHLDALVRSGQLAGAQNLLQPQVRAQPESRRLRRQGAQLYAALGLAHAAERLL